MTVKELINKLKEFPEDYEVFFRKPHFTGNIKEVDRVDKDFYNFFGKTIPCIILDEATNNKK